MEGGRRLTQRELRALWADKRFADRQVGRPTGEKAHWQALLDSGA